MGVALKSLGLKGKGILSGGRRVPGRSGRSRRKVLSGGRRVPGRSGRSRQKPSR